MVSIASPLPNKAVCAIKRPEEPNGKKIQFNQINHKTELNVIE